MAKIFISYARKDKEEVYPVLEFLEKNGYECWIDKNGIESGDQFKKVIITAINQCEVFLYMLSGNSVNSEWVEKEYSYAKRKSKRIIPFFLKGAAEIDEIIFDWDIIDHIDINDIGWKEKLLNDLRDVSKVENHDLKMKQENDESTEIPLKAAEEGDAKTKTILSCSNPFEMVIKSKTYHEIGVSTNVRGYIKAGSISVGDLVSVGDSLKTGIVDKISKVTIEKQYSSSLYGAPDIIHKKSIEIAGAEDGEVELIIRIPPNDICVNDVLHLREKAYAKTIESKNKIKVGTIMLKSANSGRNIFEVLNGKLKPGYYISSLGRVGKIIDYFSNSEILILNQGCTAFVSFERNSSVSTYSGQTFDILI